MTNAYNPKEYFELSETAKKKKKKHKEIKEGLSGMNFKNYASRIIFQTNFDIFEKPPAGCKEVSRLIVHQGGMKKRTSVKTKFSQFNDKRFYFSNRITSLPLSHSCLKELVEYIQKIGQKTERYFWDEKEVLLDKLVNRMKPCS